MDSASLRVPIENTIFQSVFGMLCGWRHKWGCFCVVFAHVSWPWTPTQRAVSRL